MCLVRMSPYEIRIRPLYLSGLTITEIVDRLNITYTTVHRWVTRPSKPWPPASSITLAVLYARLKKISDAYDTNWLDMERTLNHSQGSRRKYLRKEHVLNERDSQLRRRLQRVDPNYFSRPLDMSGFKSLELSSSTAVT